MVIREVDMREPAVGVTTICNKWHLTAEEATSLLGHNDLDRTMLTIKIYKTLHKLYTSELADAWMTHENANPLFHGESPIQHVTHEGTTGLTHTLELLNNLHQ